MSHIWTVKDSAGRIVPNFKGASRLDVERRLVPGHYDAFRLHVSHSYREVFDREVAKVLSDKRWRVIRTRASTRGGSRQQPSGREIGSQALVHC